MVNLQYHIDYADITWVFHFEGIRNFTAVMAENDSFQQKTSHKKENINNSAKTCDIQGLTYRVVIRDSR